MVLGFFIDVQSKPSSTKKRINLNQERKIIVSDPPLNDHQRLNHERC
jgi:hypothetical protein